MVHKATQPEVVVTPLKSQPTSTWPQTYHSHRISTPPPKSETLREEQSQGFHDWFKVRTEETGSARRPLSSVTKPSKRQKLQPTVEAPSWSRAVRCLPPSAQVVESVSDIPVQGHPLGLAWIFADFTTTIRADGKAAVGSRRFLKQKTKASTFDERFPAVLGLVAVVVNGTDFHCFVLNTPTPAVVVDLLSLGPSTCIIANIKEFIMPLLTPDNNFNPVPFVSSLPGPPIDPFLLSWCIRPDMIDCRVDSLKSAGPLDFLLDAWGVSEAVTRPGSPWTLVCDDVINVCRLCRHLNTLARQQPQIME